MQRITVGAWRTGDAGPMQVVSGPVGRERVHFEAPEAKRLKAEMKRFLAWFNGPSDVDPVLKAGVAHFWFVTIHPFDDGNGRIARVIADPWISPGGWRGFSGASITPWRTPTRRSARYSTRRSSGSASTANRSMNGN